MLRVIREVKPAWVVGENVAGLLSMDGGAVFEEICASLEDEGYVVEAFVLPAISRGAPHRRDRVWIVAHAPQFTDRRRSSENGRQKRNDISESSLTDSIHGFTTNADSGRFPKRQPSIYGTQDEKAVPDSLGDAAFDTFHPETTEQQWTERTRAWREGFTDNNGQSRLVGVPNKPRLERYRGHDQRPGEWFIGEADSEHREQWREHWYEAATRLCGVHDGLSGGVDRSKRLKALGNAIVPQIAFEIFRAIKARELSINP